MEIIYCMKDKITTSVVLSTYNGAKYIIEQLDSLRNQSVSPDEVLIFDDQSTDETLDMLRTYIEKYNLYNWIVTVNECNKGWKRNFVEGIAKARGELVFPCDQDDIWLPNKIEESINIMKDQKINVLVSYLYLYFKDKKSKIFPHHSNKKVSQIALTKNFMRIAFPGCVYCVRKEFADKCINYWKESFPHDALFWRMSMFEESLYVYRQPLIKWRKHFDSTFTVEAKNSHSIEIKKQELIYVDQVVSAIEHYLLDSNNINEKKTKILNGAKIWNDYRKDLFLNHNLVAALKLLGYLQYYATIKRYFLDLYLVIFKKQ